MKVRALERHEIDSSARALALAFDTDPLFCWFLPEARKRSTWLRWFQRRALGEALAVGGAYTLDEGPESGAIGIYPPGAWPPKILDLIGATPVPPGLPTARLLGAGLRIERWIHRLHPPEPHVYVYVLGVHPSRQGHGLGGRLLRHACDLASAQRVVAHLETSNPDNVTFYRRFGFEVKEELAAHGGPPLWVMTTAPHEGGGPMSSP